MPTKTLENIAAPSGVVNIHGDTDDKTIGEILKEKHPRSLNINPDTILAKRFLNIRFHPIMFKTTNTDDIKEASLRTKGSAEP